MTLHEISRRDAAGHIVALTLLPFAGLIAPRPARAADLNPAGRASASGNYLLSRSLHREVGPGVAIDVNRSWRIAITPHDDGFTVSGVQQAAEVTAPAILGPLAALERQRDASALFPMTLDFTGQILRSGHEDGTTLLRGVETARALFRSLPSAPYASRGASGDMLSQIQRMSAGAVSRVPRDLFFPLPGESQETHRIELPGKGTGLVIVSSSATAEVETGRLLMSRRDIVTRIDERSLCASEEWKLSPV